MRKIIWLCIILLLLPAAAFAAEPIIASGCSVSNVGYLNDLVREYERLNPGTTMLIRGGGSLLGITELRGEKIDFAASCKSKGPKDPEEFEFIPAAWDALVFIVNKSNPIDSVSIEDVRRIYDHEITNWKQLGGRDAAIKSVVSTPEGMGGVGEALSKYVLGGRPISHKPNSIIVASSVTVWEQMVEKDPDAFASTGFASARKRDVKMLKLNGVPPTKENIVSGKYPLKRYLYLVIDKKDVRPDVKKFVAFVLSKEGQAFISRLGIPALAEIK